MKIIFALCLLLALAACNNQTIGVTTLVDPSDFKMDFSLSTTAIDSTSGAGTYSAVVNITTTAAPTAASFYAALCIGTGTTSHSLSADKTGLKIFIAETQTGANTAGTAWGWNETDSAGSFIWYSSAVANYTHSSTAYNTGATAPATRATAPGTDTASGATQTTYTLTYTGLADADRTTLGLPMSNESEAYLCWSQTASATTVAATEVVATAQGWAAGKNITIGAYGAAAIAGFAATLAYAF